MQANASIKKEPAFNEEQAKMSLPKSEERVNLFDREFDPTDINMVNAYKQVVEQTIETTEEKKKINPDNPRLTDYEMYEIWSPYGAKYRQIRKAHLTPEQEEEIKQAVEQAIKNNPLLGRRCFLPTSSNDISSNTIKYEFGKYIDGGPAVGVILMDEDDIRKMSEILPLDLEDARREAIDYAKSYGIESIDTVLAILMPPQLKGLLAVVLFTKAVCKVAVKIKQKRENEIAKIRNLEEYTEAQKKQMIDDNMTAWILEAVGEGLLDEMLNMVLDKVKLSGGKDIPEHIKIHVKTVWGKFIMND